MFEYREIPETNIVEFTIDGKITAQEFDEVIERLEAAIAQHGTIRVLEHIRSFGGMPAAKWWDDIKFGFRHARHVSRAAVVAEKKWIEVFTRLVSPFVSAEVRYFDAAEIDEARRWLREPEPADIQAPLAS
jgi:hypothetical protein